MTEHKSPTLTIHNGRSELQRQPVYALLTVCYAFTLLQLLHAAQVSENVWLQVSMHETSYIPRVSSITTPRPDVPRLPYAGLALGVCGTM